MSTLPISHRIFSALKFIEKNSNQFGDEIFKIAQKCLSIKSNEENIKKLTSKLKERINFFKSTKNELQKSDLKLTKLVFSLLVDMEEEKDRVSDLVEREFLAGNFENSIKILETSDLRFSQNPLHKAYYYGERARLYLLFGQISRAQKFIDKENLFINRIESPQDFDERKFLQAQSYANQIDYHIKSLWHEENSPYTSKTLKDNPLAKELETIACQWKVLFQKDSSIRGQHEFCRACSALANIYMQQELYANAIEVFKEGLSVSCEASLHQLFIELSIHLGDCYQHLGAYSEAIEHYENAETIARKQNVLHAVATCLVNKAFCRHRILLTGRELMSKINIALIADDINKMFGFSTNNAKKTEDKTQQLLIEKEFREAIDIFSQLEWELEDVENQIQYFNVHDIAYIAFENFLYAENRENDALEIAQLRRARALKAFIRKKYPSLHLDPKQVLSVDQIKDLAKSLNTTFIVYSLAPCQFYKSSPTLRRWVISSSNMHSDMVPIPHLKEEVKDFSDRMKDILEKQRKTVADTVKIIKEEIGNTEKICNDLTVDSLLDDPNMMEKLQNHPKIRKEALSNLEILIAKLKEAISKVNAQLEHWYPVFIPQELLTEKSKTSLTIIPEGMLAHIPFAALRYNSKSAIRCLIEDFPISVAPSISVLPILDQIKKNTPQTEDKGLVIYSNPDEHLQHAEQEVHGVSTSLKQMHVKQVESSRGDDATYSAFFSKINAVRYTFIHIICHGTDEQASKPDSIFGGALKFVELNNEGYKYIYGNDIAQQHFGSKLVFISSCLSGKGKIHQEGNVGLSWAFLAAGVQSVVSCLWPLYDSDLTIKMISRFYDSLEEGKNKTVALREAMLLGLKNNVDRPDKWGLFFLSGIDDRIGPELIKAKESTADLSFLDFL